MDTYSKLAGLLGKKPVAGPYHDDVNDVAEFAESSAPVLKQSHNLYKAIRPKDTKR